MACDGRGLCAELIPERIRLDDWGYPMIDKRPIGADLMEYAERAVRTCPKLALSIEQSEI
jgi:ferredoxin